MDLPEISPSASPDFADAEGARQWLEHVPLANVAAAQRQLLVQIEAFNSYATSAAERLATMEALREAANFVQIEQAKRFSNRALPMADAELAIFEDTDDQPIEQTMRFERVPIMANVRLSLRSRGRQIGRLAWVPTRVVPWLCAGAGPMWYRFRQEGDFVNSETNIIRTDNLDSQGWTTTAHALAGLDYSLSPRFAITGEGRYDWGEARLDDLVFEGFEPIDLSGLSATVGIQFRL
jgi:hypothetical protein